VKFAAALAVLSLAMFVCPTGPIAAPGFARGWCAGGETVAAARKDLGQPVRVKARVVRASWARSAKGRPTFLDLGYAYPSKRRLSVVIWGSDRANFPGAPERMFRAGTLVCVQGVVSSYRGAAQIRVSLWDAADRVLTF
jgi:hypothetical protein